MLYGEIQIMTIEYSVQLKYNQTQEVSSKVAQTVVFDLDFVIKYQDLMLLG